MARLHVEAWAPDYGSPLDLALEEGEAPKVDETVEISGAWDPIAGVDDGTKEVTFVDGVRRVDARLTLDEPAGPVPGICGSIGVGAVRWNRTVPMSEVHEVRVDRLALFLSGRAADIAPLGSELVYRTESVAESDPGMLVQRFHGAMRSAEWALAEKLAQGGSFVIADGPLNDLSPTEKIGYIKTHRVPYLSDSGAATIARLAPGQRTPMFLIGSSTAYPRYSWYVRLGEVPHGHSWSAVVRCEASSSLTVDHASRLADRSAALLPMVAAPLHVDPRAPQNLVPIAALERELRRRLGDPGLIYRRLRSALAVGEAV